VAVTVSVPLAVVCATAAEEIIISAAKMVKSITFFIGVPLLMYLHNL
jgi:ACR3 family arsenite efflux pump ArsB